MKKAGATKAEMIAANEAKCSVCKTWFAPCDDLNFRDGPVKCITCLRKAFQRLCDYGSHPAAPTRNY